MVEKRLRKGEGLMEEVVPPNYDGDNDPEILLVAWGSTAGSVNEAAAALRDRGAKVATLCFSQVWPIVSDHFVEKLKPPKRVVCVEGNACGQFARLLQRETGYKITEEILRYDGLPITPEYILRRMKG
jgi:2-oxoglutarate ferredoxin oxidoreductase subunit alpha